MINRQKLQTFIDSYKDKFIKDLDETCKDLLDTNDTNLIDSDKEYDIPKNDYIISEPMIHLDVDKIDNCFGNFIINFQRNDINNPNFDTSSITKLSMSNNHEIRHQKNTIRINFPINTKLTKNEYVIKFYMITLNNDRHIDNLNDNFKGTSRNQRMNYTFNRKSFSGFKEINPCIEDKYTIIYITNYGRIIKADNINNYIFYYSTDSRNYSHCIATDKFKTIENNKLYFCSMVGDILTKTESTKALNPVSITLVDVPELNYKMPKIFIDVIDAFHKQDTDLMQSCCKKYLETLNKTKSCDKIVEKNKIIEEQQIIIKQKDKEIERLKLELEELKKFYINS